MPRRATSSMAPIEFKFLRDLLGFTQTDVAHYVGVSSPRVVADWDTQRNPNTDAAAWVIEQKELFASRVQETLDGPLPEMIDDDGNTVVCLKRYEDDAALHADHPEFERVRHYDAHLRGVASALAARGIAYTITA